MRGVVVELPEAAAKRFAELQAAKMAAEDAMRSAQGRINSLPRDAVQLREKLEVERDRQADRHRVLALLVSRCNQWNMELRLPPGAVLESAPVPAVRLRASETCAVALASAREQIARVQGEIAAVRKAPLQKSSKVEAVRVYLRRLSEQAQPKVVIDGRGNARVQWIEDMATMDGVVGLLAFVLGSQELAAAFTRDLDEQGESPDALSPLEKEKRIGELAQQLLALERTEESLVERSEAEGVPQPRRGDADPRAVLGVVIVAKEVAAA